MKQKFALLHLILLLAHATFATAADDTTRANTSGGITEVSVERTWCNGSCPIDTLVLHADGKAEYTGKENTNRVGQFTGAYWNGDFDQLARWLVADGFFELEDSYGFPVADNPTEVIGVTRGGERKSVVNFGRNRSLKLWSTGNLIRGIAAQIRWQPASAGIRGQTSGGPVYVDPEKTPSGTRERFIVLPDREGRFEIPLPTGTYRISSERIEMTRGNPQTVVVEPNQFTEVNLRSEAEASNVPKSNASQAVVDPLPPPGDGL